MKIVAGEKLFGKDLSLQKKVGIGFGLSILILLIAGFSLYQSLMRSVEATNWVRHTHEEIEHLEFLVSDMKDCETSLRGYLIVHNAEFAEAYQTRRVIVQDELKRVRALMANNPQQLKRLDQVEHIIQIKFRAMEEMRRLNALKGSSRQKILENLYQGKATMDQIRSLVTTMQQAEERLLVQRDQALNENITETLWIAAFCGVLFLLQLVLMYQLINREIRKREHSEDILRQNEAKFRRIVDANILGIIFTHTGQGGIYEANQAFLDMVGYTAEDLAQGTISWRDLTPSDWNARDDQALAELDATGVCTPYEKQYFHKDGHRVDILSGAALLDETKQHSVAFLLDITEQKALQQKIGQLNQALENQVVVLNNTNRELESFSYSVSHDLRTPLRSIDGFAQLLLKKYGDGLDETGRDYLDRVVKSSQLMAQLIDDLLNLSRLSRGTLTVESVDLSGMAHKIIQELSEQEPGRRVACEIQDGLLVQGDSRLLKAALQNLLANAWKFTGKRDHPRIAFGKRDENGKGSVFFVEDNGAGFDMAYTERLFGAFQRLHSTQEFPGTGIGLATVQRVMSRHGGKVWVEAEVDKGATFYFSL